jgi:hypothetical protein
MIHWTHGGAVTTPTTVQIRLASQNLPTLQAKAPIPRRRLSKTEFLRNLEYFHIGLHGPRSIPCTAVTISGMDTENIQYIEELRNHKYFAYNSLHIDYQLDLWAYLETVQDCFDKISLPIPSTLDRETWTHIEKIPTWSVPSTNFILSLANPNKESIEEFIQRYHPLVQWAKEHDWQLFCSYPFPTNAAVSPLSPKDCAIFLSYLHREKLPRSPIVKGIPSCVLNTPSLQTSKTSNRWYVDAEHQLQQALLFFPEIMQFYKSDNCRFCALDHQCDGFFAEYLRDFDVNLQPVYV